MWRASCSVGELTAFVLRKKICFKYCSLRARVNYEMQKDVHKICYGLGRLQIPTEHEPASVHVLNQSRKQTSAAPAMHAELPLNSKPHRILPDPVLSPPNLRQSLRVIPSEIPPRRKDTMLLWKDLGDPCPIPVRTAKLAEELSNRPVARYLVLRVLEWM